MQILLMIVSLKSFECKAKLSENMETEGANRILKNARIAMPLRYLTKCWRSLEMPLINCKVKLKFRWISIVF